MGRRQRRMFRAGASAGGAVGTRGHSSGRDRQGQTMTIENFFTIRELTEAPEGLRIEHHNGQTSLLRRDNQRYARIEDLLQRTLRLSSRVPWPVRVARTPEGVIENAWPAWPGRPIYVDDVVGPDE